MYVEYYLEFVMIFVGCMFIGYGIGSLLGNSEAGAVIGMGVGFLVNHFYDNE